MTHKTSCHSKSCVGECSGIINYDEAGWADKLEAVEADRDWWRDEFHKTLEAFGREYNNAGILRAQLSESQAREKVMREALEEIIELDGKFGCESVDVALQALAATAEKEKV